MKPRYGPQNFVSLYVTVSEFRGRGQVPLIIKFFPLKNLVTSKLKINKMFSN